MRLGPCQYGFFTEGERLVLDESRGTGEEKRARSCTVMQHLFLARLNTQGGMNLKGTANILESAQ